MEKRFKTSNCPPPPPLLFTINQTTHCLWNLRDWMLLMQGMFTGLLGNLSLLSYFTKKREKEVIVVQTLGVVSQYVVFLQLAMAEAMPLPYFLITSVVVAAGLILNFTNYFNLLNAGIWRIWEDFITVGGLSVLPQVISSSLSLSLSLYLHAQTHTQTSILKFILVFRQWQYLFISGTYNSDPFKHVWMQIMWSTFVPYIPNSILPGAIAFVIAVTAVIMVSFTYLWAVYLLLFMLLW